MIKPKLVAVIGLGYVGIPTIVAMTRAGLNVVGIDVNKKRVDQLNQGKSFIAEISNEVIKETNKNFVATTDWKKVKDCDVIIITVPTPITKNKEPDVSAIRAAGLEISRFLQPNTLVVLESTTYPGTTEEVLKPALEQSGLIAGKDFSLAFAPERIDPGNKQYEFVDVPKVVGGIDEKSTDLAAEFYGIFLKNIHKVSSAKSAEMTKLLENIFRLVNISMINELKMLCDKMGINLWEVIEAAKTKPYGFMAFYPGPGVGGHCIPVDPFYLSWKAKEFNFFARFIELAGEINELMPHHIVTKVISVLNKQKKPVNGSKILVLGAAFKKDIDDYRESPSAEIIGDLLGKGGDVMYNDPFIPKIEINGKEMVSYPLTAETIRDFDLVVILTDHSSYDYQMIANEAKLVIDTRNAIKVNNPKIIL